MTASRRAGGEDRRDIRVFVHLARGFDARTWEQAWRDGSLVGFNTRTPYGYHLAEAYGFEVRFSRDGREGVGAKGLRLALRALLGFDLLHAWRNRHEALKADVIWTHTESQFLAFALILRLTRKADPKLLGQCVWLFDRWTRFSVLHRALYRWLIGRVDVLTTLSPLNLDRARRLFPETRSDLVLFGIPTDLRRPPGEASLRTPLRIVALGNDEHRDWPVLIEAVGGRSGLTAEIASATARLDRADASGNIALRRIRKNDELRAFYRDADLVAIPLKPNLHASGITVMQEAALSGVPMIATDVGGLRAYFSDEAVRYVPPGDPAAFAEAIAELAAAPGRRSALARAAQARMGDRGLGAEGYIRRHVELTLELLGDPSERTAVTIADAGAGPA